MSSWMQDIRFALRSFAKDPWFTLVAVLSLAIGIGANTSIFSVANALLFRPLPYENPDRLVILWNRSPGLGITQDWFSTAQYFDIKNGHSGFGQVAIAIGGNYNLTGQGEPERVGAIRGSSNLLPMLGARPALGRLLTQDEDLSGLPATALLTDGMWARRFGRDPHVIGKSIIINGQAYEIVGVLPQGFSLPQEVVPLLDGTEQAEIFLPLPLSPTAASLVRDHEDYNIVGKLKPGVSVTQAQAEMDTITARLRRQFPESYPPNGGLTFSIVPLLEQVVGNVRRSLWVLLASVGFVLLIACANVANLMLSRALARQQEIAVRTALGATRWDIIRQLLTESLLISLCGGALGVLICLVSVKGIHILGTKSIPRLQDVAIDGRVLLFTMLLSIFSGILFGLFPALRVSRLDLNSTLKDTSRGSAGANAVWGRGNNFRRLLVISELALSVVLLIGAGLLIRSFARLQNVSPGFNPRGVLTFDLTMTGRKYNDGPTILNTYRQLWERLEHSHGGIAAGGVTSLPLSEAFAWTPITVEGRVPLPGEKFLNADERVVGGHYFPAMQIPLKRGRFFNEQDGMAKPVVVLVDEYMADQLWPGQDPIGKRIHIVQLESKDPWQTVVGVVGRVKQDSLDSDPRIAFYVAQTQFPTRAMTVTFRGDTTPSALLATSKSELRNLDPDLPMYHVRTMEQRVDESLARRRFSMLLLGLFGAIALTLASIGIYGVMAYLVNQGTRELGIRIALGASPRNILSLVVRQGMALAVAGVTVGLAAAFLLARLIRSLLFGVDASDPGTFAGISFLLAIITLLACYIPARRAARIDPLVSLRCD
ncbi:MAG TPA: ABC transporter permease [Candidatus Sulfotelmatobacter sp.]|jgi:predicted permease|nr:ABC transporter permease [Candidatus Sulfotelmatobacter sp.]